MASTKERMEGDTKDNGFMICKTDMVRRYGLITAATRDTSNTVRNTDRVLTTGQIVPFTKASGRITR